MTGSELRYKLKEVGVSFADLSEKLGITPQHFQSKLKSKDIKIEFVQEIARAINKNIYFFIGEEGKDAYLNAYPNAYPIDKKEHLIKNDLLNDAGESYTRQGNVLLVPVKAHAGYLAGYGDPEYIEKLEYYNIPGCRHGNYRMFEIEGDSMLPGLKHGDYAIGQAVTDCCQIKSGTIYIIVSREEGIVIKRVLNGHKLKGVVILNSDNEDKQLYPPIVIQGTAILECWELYRIITDPPAAEYPLIRRLNKMEREWAEFRRSFRKK